ARHGKHGNRSILAAEYLIESVEGLSVLEISAARIVHSCDQARCDHSNNQHGLQVMSMRHGDGEQPDLLLVVQNVRSQFYPRDRSLWRWRGRRSRRGRGLSLRGSPRLRPAWLQCSASDQQQKSGLEAVNCQSNAGRAIAEASTNSAWSSYTR